MCVCVCQGIAGIQSGYFFCSRAVIISQRFETEIAKGICKVWPCLFSSTGSVISSFPEMRGQRELTIVAVCIHSLILPDNSRRK